LASRWPGSAQQALIAIVLSLISLTIIIFPILDFITLAKMETREPVSLETIAASRNLLPMRGSVTHRHGEFDT
jgi:putative exporter of polyketide antibiotics